MKPKTEEFLYLLLWSADQFCRPTFRNLTDSFETWAYRNGLWRQLIRLEHQRLVESENRGAEDRLYRLTRGGRLHALGGRDPEMWWTREWDGRWRLVLFDVPKRQNSERDRLRRYLAGKGFGYLQDSVWITPDSLDGERQTLAGGRINVESLLLLEARPCAGESNSEIVAGAWDFDAINQGYTQHLQILAERPEALVEDEITAKALLKWADTERRGWAETISSDPLLPANLLPPDYLGRKVWARRLAVLRQAARQMRPFRFRPPYQTLSHVR